MQALQERDQTIRGLRDEVVQAQKNFHQQLAEETGQLTELKEHLEYLTQRKDELHQLLEDKEAEVKEVKRIHRQVSHHIDRPQNTSGFLYEVVFSPFSDSMKKWQEKADLLTRLESQVKCMKENFDSKEYLLLEERDRATEAQKYVTVWTPCTVCCSGLMAMVTT